MSEVLRLTLLQALAAKALSVARFVAWFHARVDPVLWPQSARTRSDEAITDAEELLATIRLDSDAREFPCPPGLDLHRLAALTLERTSELRRDKPRPARRPDVLRMTAQLLANPEFPWTFDAARYCVTLILRAVYQVPFSQESVRELRLAYDELAQRWSDNQKVRELKGARKMTLEARRRRERFLLDILCMNGAVDRQFDEEARKAYWDAFARDRYVLGIDLTTGERSWPGDAPQLAGRLLDFATIMNLAFGQPLGVQGLDELTGGLLPSMPNSPTSSPGGLITLVCGPPGSGKTTFCLTLAARMAELGSIVRYVATEEPAGSLTGRLDASIEPHASRLWGDLLPEAKPGKGEDSSNASGDLQIIPGNEVRFARLGALVETLMQELSPTRPPEPPERGLALSPTFRRVVVVDSLTALGKEEKRSDLAELLNKLREVGVCVFLVGGAKDAEDDSLAYLVDNVLLLGFEDEPTRRHPLRTLVMGKTRTQASRRGRHVLHLSRRSGCHVCPSLHSVLVTAKAMPWIQSDKNHSAQPWDAGNQPSRLSAQLELPSLRRFSQTLVYGRGPAGKANLALLLATEPRLRINRPHRRDSPSEEARAYLKRTRVLVVSFLYEENYYLSRAENLFNLFKKRFASSVDFDVEGRFTVYAPYPGYIDPETLVATIRGHLDRARLEGYPFTAVVIDGVHNLLLQFPLLHPEPLIWPTLYRIFRGERLEVITTFTFFKVATVEEPMATQRLVPVPGYISVGPGGGRPGASAVGSSSELFFHMLVSSCDYTFVMERPEDNSLEADALVEMVTSIDGLPPPRPRFSWDSQNFQLTHRAEPQR